ncbi:MAG TPA: ABC transporter ATP-binding protein [Blastocatellia bacterium]|jgi:ATP-binding cassette subfamily B protein|nr:ABC transporter ATP-binding protein [Blastocatellia bacterium]
MSRAPGLRRTLQNQELPSLREQFSALRHVLPLLKLVWKTHRGYTSAIVILRLLQAFIPVATLWVGKLIIDTVVAAQSSGSYAGLWKLVLIEIGIVVAGDVLSRASILYESLLGDLFSNYTSIRLMEHAATLDLYHFEDPSFYDQLERARRQTTNRIGLLALLLGMGSGILTLISLSAVLLVYSPWLLLLLVVSVLPSFFGETRMASLGYSLLFRWTPERRQLDYLRYLGASDETAKEVQMFGLSRWIVDRYRVLSDRFYQENKKLSVKRAFVSSGLSFIGTLGYYTAYAVILFRAVQGSITLGSLTFLAGSFARSRDIIRSLLINASDIYSQSLYVKDLFDFFEMKPSIVSRKDALPVPQPIREGFVFENVGFRYPGSDVWAVRNVSFHLRPGERIALVGENGAGKTTLTKLLARLYDPSEGRVLLDGVDLREYDLSSVRQAIGVIFQDFVRYDLRFDENIGIGEINKVRSYLDLARNGDREDKPASAETESSGHAVPEPIVTAADKSLAASLLARFPENYRQMLGRRFEGGVELSGGEWQKVALARAYMRDAQVLILDEPTAALDARAEYEVFTRFSELVSGRMAVIISHRFSTVRVADRIIVLKNGSVVEDGTHAELIMRGGLYSELFALQAEGYR